MFNRKAKDIDALIAIAVEETVDYSQQKEVHFLIYILLKVP